MARKRIVETPIQHSVLAKRARLAPDGELATISVPLVDASLTGLKSTETIQEAGRLRVLAKVDANGLPGRRRFQRIPTISLTQKEIDPRLARQDLKGHRPSGVPTSFVPKKAKATRRIAKANDKNLDRSGTIFGDDDRYLFDDRSFPWRTTGKVRTAGGWGSGTTIGPRLVLTASHAVNWMGAADGAVDWITFTPGYFDGLGPWGEIAATHVIYWDQMSGPLSDQQTAFDYVVLVMEERIGDIVGYPGFRAYDSSFNGGAYWQYIGYPGELSSGERPAFQGDGVVSTVQNKSLSGQTGYVLGHFNEFTPGQSGGAAWGWWGDEPWPRVVGVGSTIGSTETKKPTDSTEGDNEYGGGPALSALIAWARSNFA